MYVDSMHNVSHIVRVGNDDIAKRQKSNPVDKERSGNFLFLILEEQSGHKCTSPLTTRLG
jgi:hypothetical protein